MMPVRVSRVLACTDADIGRRFVLFLISYS